MAPHHSDSDEDSITSVELSPPTDISPYEVLGLERSATADQVKSAYRKAALKHHPDKATTESKDEAHKKFQEIAFAYAILSDPDRRRRYDTTGNTAESLEDSDFDWADFFRAQSEAITGSSIDKIKSEYQHSAEEQADILRVYTENMGDMDAVYEEVMCSNVLEDDIRFRNIIDTAIKDGEVEEFDKYKKESKAARKKRVQKAKDEASEAMEYAEELGVSEKLFGKKAKKEKNSEDALRDLIQQRQKGRAESFFDGLEAKYGGNKKRRVEEPPEEAFQRNAKQSKRKAK